MIPTTQGGRAGKRGHANTLLWSLIAAFALASVAGIGVLGSAFQSLDRTLLEKNFIARDLAMAIEAVYASPGDINYTYNLGDYRYMIDVLGGKVFVRDGNGEVSYRIIGVPAAGSAYVGHDNPEGLKVKMPGFATARVLDAKECKKPARIVLSKRFEADGSSEISISGSNAFLICRKASGGDFDSDCVGRVVNCG